MLYTAAMIEPVAQYCGRFDASWSGEILNSASNISFVIAAALGLMMWCGGARRELAVLGLIVAALGIGVGSFVFHSHPTASTRIVDLVSIHVFAFGVIGFALRRWLGLSWLVTLATAATFAAIGRGWEHIVGSALHGAATHALSLVMLAAIGAWLVRDPLSHVIGHGAGHNIGHGIGRRLLSAAGWYAAALAVRAMDVPMCKTLPIGVHWVWHLLLGATIGHVLAAACETSAARYAPDRAAGIAPTATA